MDITVYLPSQLGKLAKDEGLNLSRILRDAVTEKLEARGITWDSDFVTLDEATDLIREALKDGKWHRRRLLGEMLPTIRDAHWGAVRKGLNIELRRSEGWGQPGAGYEWRLPRGEAENA